MKPGQKVWLVPARFLVHSTILMMVAPSGCSFSVVISFNSFSRSVAVHSLDSMSMKSHNCIIATTFWPGTDRPLYTNFLGIRFSLTGFPF
jgi:hypothetical protein